MDFSELKRMCEVNHISTTKLAVELGMTYDGMKKSIINQSLAMRFIIPLCEQLCISPNTFFGYKDRTSPSQMQNGGVGNTQYMDTGAIQILHTQLQEKDRQIAEKDKQISELLSKI